MKELGVFGGWGSALGALIFDLVSTVAMGTVIGSTIISSSIALTTGMVEPGALRAKPDKPRPFASECLEKQFGKSEWVLNRSSEGDEEGALTGFFEVRL